jgi:hypothetical protein
VEKITKQQIKQLAESNGYEYASIQALINVESSGKGFDETTGKILIQFEPAWYRKYEPFTPSGAWSVNKVERQAAEWKAFNNAYAYHPIAAMMSTSIGMMQVMGFNYKACGFADVGEMWDYAKVSEANQVEIAIRFIKSKKELDHALVLKNWPNVALYYNGENFWKHKYHIKLRDEYVKALKVIF